MILNLIYSIASIVYLSKKSPKLFTMLNQNIKNTKKEIKNTKTNGTYQTLLILLGMFGVHNMYEKRYTLGITKLVIMINYFIYEYFIYKYKNEHTKEFEEFIKNKKIDEPEKKMINKYKSIEYTVKDGDNKEYKYYLTHNINDYIKRKNHYFSIYKTITTILFLFNALHYVIDCIKLF